MLALNNFLSWVRVRVQHSFGHYVELTRLEIATRRRGRSRLSGPRPFTTVVSSFFLVAFLLAEAFPSRAGDHNSVLSRLVVVGDSLSAGYQNGSLLDSQQVNGYANLIASQA